MVYKSRSQSVVVGKVRGDLRQLATSTFKSREMNACMLATAQPTLYTYMAQSPVHEKMLSTFMVCLPSSISPAENNLSQACPEANQIEIISHSPVILGCVKLTAKAGHHFIIAEAS